jgi:hypothetical protein
MASVKFDQPSLAWEAAALDWTVSVALSRRIPVYY